MSETSVSPLFRETHSDWVRLQTLTLLRWLAICGQLVAILAASLVFGLQLPFSACLIVVAMSVAVNLLVDFIFPQSQRLSEPQALALLVYDMGQVDRRRLPHRPPPRLRQARRRLPSSAGGALHRPHTLWTRPASGAAVVEMLVPVILTGGEHVNYTHTTPTRPKQDVATPVDRHR
ncbi:MAG: hypothetical protein ACKV22_19065 [Bryobacteraceae bacterium]